MRVDCKYYESRTYASGETVRMCRLGLAPEAPWRCPEECAGYARRTMDVGWSHGSLQAKPGPEEPVAADEAAASSILEQAADILNSAGPSIVADVERKRSGKKRRWKRR